MVDFFGTYGGHLSGFGGFLTAIAAVLYARACCGVRSERSRLGLATSIGAKFGCSQTQKSVTKMAEQRERARKSVTERIARACASRTFDPAEWHRATD